MIGSDFNTRETRLESVKGQVFVLDSRRDIVEIMLKKLEAYNSTAVPVKWSKFDYTANPEFHNGFWQPWILSRGKTLFCCKHLSSFLN